MQKNKTKKNPKQNKQKHTQTQKTIKKSPKKWRNVFVLFALATQLSIAQTCSRENKNDGEKRQKQDGVKHHEADLNLSINKY